MRSVGRSSCRRCRLCVLFSFDDVVRSLYDAARRYDTAQVREGIDRSAAADDRSGTEDASASYIGAVAEKCTDLAQTGLVIAGAADDDIFTVGLQV